MSAKTQHHEACNFKALWDFLLITLMPLGLFFFFDILWDNVKRLNYTCYPTCLHHTLESVIEHTKPSAASGTKTQEARHLPDILPLLQYWQADGAFLLCVFICPLVFVLLTVQLSLFVRNVCFWWAVSINNCYYRWLNKILWIQTQATQLKHCSKIRSMY